MRFVPHPEWSRFILLALSCSPFGVMAEEPAPDRGAPLRLSVTFPAGVREEPVTGRVLLFLSQSEHGEPRRKMNWFQPEPVFAIDVRDLRPGEPVVFAPDNFYAPAALAFPEPLGRLEPGSYHAQVVIDLDRTRRDYNEGPGNLFSRVVPVELIGARGGAFKLVADQRVEEPVHADTEWIKFVRIRSEKLSRFHRRDVFLQAAVLLPFGYEAEPERRYPVSYIVPGFGGRHPELLRSVSVANPRGADWKRGTLPFRGFEVMLDPDVPTGHSVFANSANNGPVGDALVEELIPALESRFRMIAEARGRFVRGHSSGGWSSLWLQVTYPDFFGGCWSLAPDPVDFRAFQTMNIYEDPNGHWTREGFPRPVARTRTEPRLNFIQFNHLEYVLGEGGQLDSFNAVFSPRGAAGEPRPLMDKLTGAIDREVARHWQQYDIRLLLQQRWPELGPKLQGKLRVIGGAWDTFYLEPALYHLKAFLDPLDHGGYVEIHPGDHGSFLTPELRERIDREMAEQFSAAPTVGKVPAKAQPDDGALLTLPIRFHVTQGAIMTVKGREMDVWVKPSDLTGPVLQEVNRVWKPANIQFTVERAQVLPLLQPANFAELLRSVENSKRGDVESPDSKRTGNIAKLLDPAQRHPSALNVYLLPYIGRTFQGYATLGGNQAVVGVWTDKFSRGEKPPVKALLVEPEPMKFGSLARTIAHELGHNLTLVHPDKSIESDIGRLMGGRKQGYGLTPEEIAKARQSARKHLAN